MGSIPLKVWLLSVPILISAFVTFLAGFAVLAEGRPISSDGRYYLDYKGHRVRELEAPEFRRLVGYETRLWFGHPTVFNLVAWIYFTYREPLTRQREGKD